AYRPGVACRNRRARRGPSARAATHRHGRPRRRTRRGALILGGPEMAPQTPQRSSRPGGAVARLDLARVPGAPRWPPKPPNARHAPAEPWRASISRTPGPPLRVAGAGAVLEAHGR